MQTSSKCTRLRQQQLQVAVGQLQQMAGEQLQVAVAAEELQVAARELGLQVERKSYYNYIPPAGSGQLNAGKKLPSSDASTASD